MKQQPTTTVSPSGKTGTITRDEMLEATKAFMADDGPFYAFYEASQRLLELRNAMGRAVPANLMDGTGSLIDEFGNGIGNALMIFHPTVVSATLDAKISRFQGTIIGSIQRMKHEGYDASAAGTESKSPPENHLQSLERSVNEISDWVIANSPLIPHEMRLPFIRDIEECRSCLAPIEAYSAKVLAYCAGIENARIAGGDVTKRGG